MLKTFPKVQEKEIEAVISFYGEDSVQIDRSRELLEGRISLELEPRSSAIVLFIDTVEGRKSFKTKQLTPIDLIFRLPADYPNTSAELTPESLWLTDDLDVHGDKLLNLVRESCEEYALKTFDVRWHDCEVAPLSCLSEGCVSYPSEKLIEEMVGEEQFERYQRIILSNALSQMDDIVLCPRARCQNPASKSNW
ncbi:hypothetical protein TELCIR_11095 [Teladorsagia circumcincta]|uniref:RWD domain-containing protein n=1 Tax=Teladorsagia circumcincta TaxID=45464 RepID=A0A2G9UA81_TELCI|nr:hypothetical protein TELCIR_11095 [Teladorsagia circumcincta]